MILFLKDFVEDAWRLNPGILILYMYGIGNIEPSAIEC